MNNLNMHGYIFIPSGKKPRIFIHTVDSQGEVHDVGYIFVRTPIAGEDLALQIPSYCEISLSDVNALPKVKPKMGTAAAEFDTAVVKELPAQSIEERFALIERRQRRMDQRQRKRIEELEAVRDELQAKVVSPADDPVPPADDPVPPADDPVPPAGDPDKSLVQDK